MEKKARGPAGEMEHEFTRYKDEQGEGFKSQADYLKSFISTITEIIERTLENLYRVDFAGNPPVTERQKKQEEVFLMALNSWKPVIAFVENHRTYIDFFMDLIEEQPYEWQNEQDWDFSITIVREYAKAYKKTKAPNRIAPAEQARLRAFFDAYITSPQDLAISKPLFPGIKPLENFHLILQGRALNTLTKTKTRNLPPAQIGLLGDAVIKLDNDFKLTIKKYAELKNGIRTTAYMLLDCLVIHFTEAGARSPQIRMPLKEYMEMRGLKDEKEARAQVLEDMEALKRIEYEAKERIRGKWVHSGSISIYGGTGFIKSGVIYFNFNADFYSQLLNYKIMEYPKELLKANPKTNPHAYYFGRYIAENYRMNEGKERQNCITIQTLLEQSPELPSYETVMATDRAVYKRIIGPVIRDLDSIEQLYYDLVNKDGDIIDNPQGLTYDDFIACKIIVDYSDFPKHEQRIAKRAKHNSKSKSKSTNKALNATNNSLTK